MKAVLLQSRRPSDPMLGHEYQCFLEQSGLTTEELSSWNCVENPPSFEKISDYDAVLVGGSGDFYVSKRNMPHFEAYSATLKALVDHSKPSFLVCYGFQALVDALGGEIVYAPERVEVGTYQLDLLPAAEHDPLFQSFPKTFAAQQGHKDQATSLPKNVHNFASSERCENQAFRIPNQAIWAVQFHPELTKNTNSDRFRYYLEGYAGTMTNAERNATLERFEDSPHASSLLHTFIQHISP